MITQTAVWEILEAWDGVQNECLSLRLGTGEMRG